jgi:uncharacterized protein YegJ (DUF2314 family)
MTTHNTGYVLTVLLSGVTAMISMLPRYRGRFVLAGLTAVALLGLPMVGIRVEENRTVNVSSADAEMNAAIAKARASLPTFWASYEGHNPSEKGHSLKVRFANPDDNGEHIWMTDVQKRTDNSYSGRFANKPEHLAGKRMGDVAEFKDADISDWMFIRNGKIAGGETIRVLLTHLPKADADALRARLETP